MTLPDSGTTPLNVSIRGFRVRNDGSTMDVSVEIGNGIASELRTLPIPVGQYYELKLTKGELTQDAFDRLEATSRAFLALRCGENLLSYGANSGQMLKSKIMRHGFSKEEASAAVSKLQSMGLIDESEDIRREAEKCLAKLWGERRIRAHLWSKGFCRDALDTLPEILSSVDFPENCAELIRKQYGSVPTDPEERRRMFAFLCRYGYSLDEVRDALRRKLE